MTPASTVKFEEEYSAETGEDGITFELELELKWSPPQVTDQANQATRHGEATAGKFELFQDAGGKFRFRLKAGNGEIIASSEAYEFQGCGPEGDQVGPDQRAGRPDRRPDLNVRAVSDAGHRSR